MTKLDKRNGWHVVAEGDVPDTTRDVWIAEQMMGNRHSRGALGLMHSLIAYYNSEWFLTFSAEQVYPILWHEIERPEIPQALREEMAP